jgi:gliding motility-associated-like protein
LINIAVHPMPEVDFSILNEEHLCQDTLIYLDNLTTIEHGQALSYLWTSSDGNPTNDGANASIIFASDGDKTIKLVAESEHGCANELEKKITVSKAIHPEFTIDFDNLPVYECGPLTLEFNNNTINEYKDDIIYNWDFGNGITSNLELPDLVTFNQSQYQDTSFYVNLSTTNQCGVSIARDTVKMKPDPSAGFIFEMDTVCADYQMEFYNKSYGILSNDPAKMFYWDFDDGTTRVVSDSADFTHSFKNIFDKDTTYTIRLIAQNSCKSDTLFKELVVVPKAVKAAFEVGNVSGCQPYTVTFESNQVSHSGNQLIWRWGDGDDSGVVGGLTREYTFEEAGEFLVSLEVINGCHMDTTMRMITVKETPMTAFSTDKDNYCIGDSIIVTNETIGDAYSIWTINEDEVNVFQPDPFFYSEPGNYTISLTSSHQVTGCQMTVSKTVTIQPSPTADFTITNTACQGKLISVVNSSIGAEKYYWIFDSLYAATPIIEEAPTYTYVTSGFKEVQLIAENQFGCQDSLFKTISIYPQPIPLFETDVSLGCTPLIVDITNKTVNPHITQGILYWDFGNGETYGEYYEVPDQVYENDSDTIASFFISLVAQNGFGCLDTLVQEIKVFPKPKSDFVITPQDSLNVDVALFIFENETPGDDVDHYWSFGDDTNSILNNDGSVSHQYMMYGNYTVTLKSVLADQCADSISKMVYVLPVLPKSDFAILDMNGIEQDTIKGCQPLKVAFEDRSLYAEHYEWDFGNDTNYNEKSPPTITYYDPGVYTISLLTTNVIGTDQILKSMVVQVYEKPQAAFDADPNIAIMPNSRINFINHSIGANEYAWDFGDGSDSSNDFEPQHSYLDTGIYIVSLVAISDIGCTDTSGTERKVKIITGGELAIPNSFTPNSDGLNDNFKPLVDGANYMNFQIFNRWGNLIFESDDPQVGWDGSYRGSESPSGVYAYKIVLEFSNGTSKSKVGEVILIR